MASLRQRLHSALSEFIRQESMSGLFVMVALVAALALANSTFSAEFEAIWSRFHTIGSAPISFRFLINDGLMSLFFLVVGLEIKRELLEGELSDRRRAIAPVVGALGGMILPAALYAAVAWNTPDRRGWGIPMATDIALSLGALALLGARVPASLKLFLTALAIVDDIGAVAVIAIFYSASIHWAFLGAAGLMTLGLVVMNRLRIRSIAPYLLGGCGIWYALLVAGVHPTLSGIVVAATIPHKGFESEDSPLVSLESRLHPFQAWVTVPLFALANAGVSLRGMSLSELGSGAPLGILLGLVVGKPVGIVVATWVAIRAKWASLPAGASWGGLWGIGAMAGIGFTVSIFVADLAGLQAVAHAKAAILAASVLSAALGVAALVTARNPKP